MNTVLQKYSNDYEEDMVFCIAKFFGYHITQYGKFH